MCCWRQGAHARGLSPCGVQDARHAAVKFPWCLGPLGFGSGPWLPRNRNLKSASRVPAAMTGIPLQSYIGRPYGSCQKLGALTPTSYSRAFVIKTSKKEPLIYRNSHMVLRMYGNQVKHLESIGALGGTLSRDPWGFLGELYGLPRYTGRI